MGGTVLLTALAFALLNLIAAYMIARAVGATAFTLDGEILVGGLLIGVLAAAGAVARWRHYLAKRRPTL